MKRLTNDDFIERSNKIHNYKFDYSLVDYKNSHIKINIICEKHGVFEQLPYQHLNGHGCPSCAGCKKNTTDNFIKLSLKIHNNKYDYSLVNYINKNTKVKIICPSHGVFEQNPSNHLKGCGCPKCSGKNLTFDDLIEKFRFVHGDKYQYFRNSFKGKSFKIKIKCKLHDHTFYQFIDNHLKGWGCSKCSKRHNYSNEEFINICKKVHNNKYDYKYINYTNTGEYIDIICPIHGKFSQLPKYHIKGHGCPICKSSKGELTIVNFLKESKIRYKAQKKFKYCKDKYSLPFDIYLPDHNMCIEYQGRQHFESIDGWGGEETLKLIKKHDEIKMNFCENNKIKLLIINYNEKNIIDILKNNIE